jgi:putative ABC transport system ATP-binding protein
MTQADIAISVRNICRDFEAGGEILRVLHNIDVDIRAGELTYLVGESGSGKTTLISIIAGILYPTTGSVSVFGTDIYALSDNDLVRFRLANIGFIFQQYNLIPSLTAAENASVPLVAAGVSRAEALERSMAVLEKLNMAAQAEKRPNQMSGGRSCLGARAETDCV